MLSWFSRSSKTEPKHPITTIEEDVNDFTHVNKTPPRSPAKEAPEPKSIIRENSDSIQIVSSYPIESNVIQLETIPDSPIESATATETPVVEPIVEPIVEDSPAEYTITYTVPVDLPVEYVVKHTAVEEDYTPAAGSESSHLHDSTLLNSDIYASCESSSDSESDSETESSSSESVNYKEMPQLVESDNETETDDEMPPLEPIQYVECIQPIQPTQFNETEVDSDETESESESESESVQHGEPIQQIHHFGIEITAANSNGWDLSMSREFSYTKSEPREEEFIETLDDFVSRIMTISDQITHQTSEDARYVSEHIVRTCADSIAELTNRISQHIRILTERECDRFYKSKPCFSCLGTVTPPHYD